MLGDISVLDKVYIVCGHTDMRKSIDGLCAIIEDQLKMDPSSRSLFLFCGRDVTGSRHYIRNRMALSSSINDCLLRETISGPGKKVK